MAALTITNLLVAAALGAALLGFGYLALRNSVATIAIVLVAWIATAALRDTVDLSVTVSGVRVLALDALSVVLVAVAVARGVSQGLRTVGRALAFALLLLLVVHIARGIAESGAETGFNYARAWLYFTAGLVYAATVPGGWDNRIWKVLIAGGVFLAALAVPYFILDGVNSASGQIYHDGVLVNWRPIVAAGALLIVQSVILALTLGWPSRRTAVYLALGAGVVTLLLQHRTLWVAGLLVGFVMLVRWAYRQDRTRATILVATGLVVLVLPLGVWGFSHAGALVDSVKEPTSEESTFIWRTDEWQQLIASNDSPSQLVAGNPSGQGWNRGVLDGTEVDVSAHNEFVDAYVRFGLAGILLLCWLGLLLWFRRTDVAAATGLTAQAVGLLLLTQLVFSVAYSLDVIQGVIVGILVAGLAAASPAPGPQPVTPTTEVASR